MNVLLLIGAVFGLTSVMMGAYIDHGLANTLTTKSLHSMISAQHYHQLYALLITLLALNCYRQRFIRIAGWTFVVGLCLFSVGIYASILLNFPLLMRTVPLGGFILMIGWVLLVLSAISARNE